jgi:hypothetical protein
MYREYVFIDMNKTTTTTLLCDRCKKNEVQFTMIVVIAAYLAGMI